jgi:hypothetical protein
MSLKLWFKNDVIEFYCRPELFGVIPKPAPAYKNIPEWFKKIPVDMKVSEPDGGPMMSAKKCLPMLDAMSVGYHIPLQGDVYFEVSEDGSAANAGLQMPSLIEFHDIRQIGEKTAPGFPTPPVKFINHWVIKTAPGWSTLFVPPINHPATHFTCLGGLVDTDQYPKEVNFPAIWHTPGFKGVLKAGTPLVTAIPIKRNAIPDVPVVREMTVKEAQKIEKIRLCQENRRHVYTKELRELR